MKPHYVTRRVAVGDSAWNDDGSPNEAGTFEGQVLLGQRWNGWAIVGFTRAQVQKVVDYIGSDTSGESATALLWKGDRLLMWQEEVNIGEGPYVEDAGPDDDGMYWPGAYSWTWIEVDR